MEIAERACEQTGLTCLDVPLPKKEGARSRLRKVRVRSGYVPVMATCANLRQKPQFQYAPGAADALAVNQLAVLTVFLDCKTDASNL